MGVKMYKFKGVAEDFAVWWLWATLLNIEDCFSSQLKAPNIETLVDKTELIYAMIDTSLDLTSKLYALNCKKQSLKN